jgi:hypothetical protein
MVIDGGSRSIQLRWQVEIAMRQASEDLECTSHARLLQAMEEEDRVVEQRINVSGQDGCWRELAQYAIGKQAWRDERIALMTRMIRTRVSEWSIDQSISRS